NVDLAPIRAAIVGRHCNGTGPEGVVRVGLDALRVDGRTTGISSGRMKMHYPRRNLKGLSIEDACSDRHLAAKSAVVQRGKKVIVLSQSAGKGNRGCTNRWTVVLNDAARPRVSNS